jgi:LPXTG-motif cell wall-anchored protein
VEGKYFFEGPTAGPPIVTPDACQRTPLPEPGATPPPTKRAAAPAKDDGSALLPLAGLALVLLAAGGWFLWRRRGTPG